LWAVHPSSLLKMNRKREVFPLTHNLYIFSNGYSIRTFQTTLKMSTYLIAFATGDLVNKTATAKDGTQISIWAWNADLGTDEVSLSGSWMNRLNVSLDTSVKCFEALSDYMGIKFPLPKLGKKRVIRYVNMRISDHLALPQFSYGGMENWGLIIYNYDFVLFKDGVKI
jgi:aminopeptidase N